MVLLCLVYIFFFFFKQKTAYEMRISDWSSRVLFRSADHRHPDDVEAHGGDCRPDQRCRALDFTHGRYSSARSNRLQTKKGGPGPTLVTPTVLRGIGRFPGNSRTQQNMPAVRPPQGRGSKRPPERESGVEGRGEAEREKT